MLVDLLNSQNYIMVNMDAINILGLNTAVYCAELLNVYKKAVLKKKFVNDNKFFKIDREFIAKRTSISVDEQLVCDLNLEKPEVAIIQKDNSNVDVIYFDIERYASILAGENVKLQEVVKEKTKSKSPKGITQAKKDYLIQQLKSSVVCSNFELLKAIHDWIDVITTNKGNLSIPQVRLFKETLDGYTKGDLDLALEIVKIAAVHSWVDCQWAINYYEKEKNYQRNNMGQVRTTGQTRATIKDLGTETF